MAWPFPGSSLGTGVDFSIRLPWSCGPQCGPFWRVPRAFPSSCWLSGPVSDGHSHHGQLFSQCPAGGEEEGLSHPPPVLREGLARLILPASWPCVVSSRGRPGNPASAGAGLLRQGQERL